MHDPLFDNPAIRELVYLAAYREPERVDAHCKKAVETGDITADELPHVIERFGKRMHNPDALAGLVERPAGDARS